MDRDGSWWDSAAAIPRGLFTSHAEFRPGLQARGEKQPGRTALITRCAMLKPFWSTATVLALGLLAMPGCKAPEASAVPENRPYEEKLEQFWPYAEGTGRRITTKADAVRVISYALSLNGADAGHFSTTSNWSRALGKAFKAIPLEMTQPADAQRKILEALYQRGYIDRAGVRVASEISPKDRSDLVALFADLIHEPVPPDLLAGHAPS